MEKLKELAHVLWLTVSEKLVNDEYEGDKLSNPNYFDVMDFQYYRVLLSPLTIIPASYLAPSYANIAKLQES